MANEKPILHKGVTPLTIEKARELFGKLPDDVENDPYYRLAFLDLHGAVAKKEGEAYIKEHAQELLSSWKYIQTLV